MPKPKCEIVVQRTTWTNWGNKTKISAYHQVHPEVYQFAPEKGPFQEETIWNDRLPTIFFQGRTVKLSECKCRRYQWNWCLDSCPTYKQVRDLKRPPKYCACTKLLHGKNGSILVWIGSNSISFGYFIRWGCHQWKLTLATKPHLSYSVWHVWFNAVYSKTWHCKCNMAQSNISIYILVVKIHTNLHAHIHK